MSMANQPVSIFVRFFCWVNQRSIFKGLVSKDLNEVGCFSPVAPLWKVYLVTRDPCYCQCAILDFPVGAVLSLCIDNRELERCLGTDHCPFLGALDLFPAWADQICSY